VSAFTVLGGRGFVGSHLARYLEAHGLPYSCPPRDDASIFTRPLGHVMYCVGLTADYAKRPFDTVEAHVGLLARVLERCQFDSLLYLSSTRLYDALGSGIAREDAALPLSVQQPRHLFDFSKGLGESLCLHASQRARVARLSSVYAQDLSSSNFLHQLVRAGVSERATTLDTSATLARDYIDVEDVCALLVAIATDGRRAVYNVASGQNVSNGEIFAVIERETGCRITPSRPPTPDRSPLIDISAIVEDFGVRPRGVLERLPSILAHHRAGGL
jgi:nucleoside-diphosphate-sugar epimerase